MKANRFSINRSALAVLTTFLLSTASLYAQTFAGQAKLADTPAKLEAAIYPLAQQPSTIKVIFNNLTGGSVRIVVRDEKGKVFYDEYEATARYRRRFDLSALPQGNYKVELSKRDEYFAQSFVVEPPVQSHIALVNPPVKTAPDKVTEPKLIVSQE
jgi:hypothetical protein